MNEARALTINDITIGFTGKNEQFLNVLREIDLSLAAGESLGIVGESGSGKSTLALAAMGYLKHGLKLEQGEVKFDKLSLFALERKILEKIRGGKLALVPQNSGQSLTPTMRVEEQLLETLKIHRKGSQLNYPRLVVELLEQVRLPEPDKLIKRFPHELSGGQQQRIAIAMALAGDPEVLLLDEPTTGLDVTTQAHILELLCEINKSRGTSMIYVSHDLGAIARVCDRVIVMYAGEVVLSGDVRSVLRSPSHPYAQSLLAAIPKLSATGFPLALEGRPPPPSGNRFGCAFADRCSAVRKQCLKETPSLKSLKTGEYCRCHFPTQDLLSVNSRSQMIKTGRNTQEDAIKLEKLSITYEQKSFLSDIFRKKSDSPATVNNINLTVAKGETLGLVGESGSGKSTILKSIAGLLSAKNGQISLKSSVVLPNLVENRSAEQLRKIQLIFQNPDESLNPRHSIEEILAQPLQLYFRMSQTKRRQLIISILNKVRLSDEYLTRFPNQLSGGEKQRVAIARAFIANPEIVLCDEVTSALDVSVQAAVLQLLNELKEEFKTTYIFVSHDLAVVKALSDRVAVLYQGRICEIGPTDAVFGQFSHPYTEVLLDAVLEPNPDIRPKLLANDTLELSPPLMGCPFQRRCTKKLGQICEREPPPPRKLDQNHSIFCHIPDHLLSSDIKKNGG